MPIPNELHFHWYGGDPPQEAVSNFLYHARKYPELKVIIFTDNENFIKKALAKEADKLRIDLDSNVPKSIEIINSEKYCKQLMNEAEKFLLTNNNIDIRNKSIKEIRLAFQDIQTKAKANPYDEAWHHARNWVLSHIQQNEGMGSMASLAWKKDVNSYLLLWKRGGVLLDADERLKAEDEELETEIADLPQCRDAKFFFREEELPETSRLSRFALETHPIAAVPQSGTMNAILDILVKNYDILNAAKLNELPLAQARRSTDKNIRVPAVTACNAAELIRRSLGKQNITFESGLDEFGREELRTSLEDERCGRYNDFFSQSQNNHLSWAYTTKAIIIPPESIHESDRTLRAFAGEEISRKHGVQLPNDITVAFKRDDKNVNIFALTTNDSQPISTTIPFFKIPRDVREILRERFPKSDCRSWEMYSDGKPGPTNGLRIDVSR